MDWIGSLGMRGGGCSSLWNYLNVLGSFIMDTREVLKNTNWNSRACHELKSST